MQRRTCLYHAGALDRNDHEGFEGGGSACHRDKGVSCFHLLFRMYSHFPLVFGNPPNIVDFPLNQQKKRAIGGLLKQTDPVGESLVIFQFSGGLKHMDGSHPRGRSSLYDVSPFAIVFAHYFGGECKACTRDKEYRAPFRWEYVWPTRFFFN